MKRRKFSGTISGRKTGTTSYPPEGVEIWDRWDKLLWGKVDMAEDAIAEMVAEELNVTPERVFKIADKKTGMGVSSSERVVVSYQNITLRSPVLG